MGLLEEIRIKDIRFFATRFGYNLITRKLRRRDIQIIKGENFSLSG